MSSGEAGLRVFKRVKYIVSISLLTILILTSMTATAFAKENQITDLETFFDNMISSKLEKYHIPNAAISVVKEGKIVYKKGFGLADIENNKPVDADTTLFRIGSTSKLVTWTAVMQLVEKGILDLNADVNTYLDFEIPPKLIDSPKNTTVEPITLTHLMTHTPGFEDYPDMLFRLSEEELLPLNEYIRKYLPARIFPAGRVAANSNYGTALAGSIVQKVSGLSFSEYVEKRLGFFQAFFSHIFYLLDAGFKRIRSRGMSRFWCTPPWQRKAVRISWRTQAATVASSTLAIASHT